MLYEVITNLLTKFYSDYAEFENAFNAVYQKDDPEEAVRAAHTLKGVSGNLGAETLRVKAAELEKAVKEGTVMEPFLEAAADAVRAVLEAVQASGVLAGPAAEEVV